MGNTAIQEILRKYEKEILGEVLGTEADYNKAAGYVKEWNINGETVTLGVERQ